jgi:hypothetical protein
MKRIKLFTMAVLMMTALAAKAQSGFSSVYVQYNPSEFHASEKGISLNSSFSAATIGFNKAISISSDMPLYIQPGAGVTYGWDSSDGVKLSMLSVKVPVNLLYSFQLPNSSVSIDPYVGIYGRAFILANQKVNGKTISWFDKDDVGESLTWNRLQLGSQVGCNFRFNNKFYIGAEYAVDLTDIIEHVSINTFGINVGLIF